MSSVGVFICFAASDRDAALMVVSRLEKTAGVHPVLDEIPDHSLPEAWESAAASQGIIVLLSSSSVPERLKREDWSGLLSHIETSADPPVACVLMNPCRYPPLLERRSFFRPDPDGMRCLQRWAVDLHPKDDQAFVPAVNRFFAGREQELKEMWSALADQPGVLAITGARRSGKTTLAQEFARQSAAYFVRTIWVNCRGRSRTNVLSSLTGSPRERRWLIVLDELGHDDLLQDLTGGAASILLTCTSNRADVPSLELQPCAHIAVERPAADDEQALWEAATVCQADCAPLHVFAAIADFPEDRARATAGRLTERRLIDRLDEAGNYYRVPCPAPLGDREESLRKRHASLVHQCFGSDIAEAEAALQWASRSDWAGATVLARRLFLFLRAERRIYEACRLLNDLQAEALRHNDAATLEFAQHELSWLAGSEWTPAGRNQEEPEQLSLNYGN